MIGRTLKFGFVFGLGLASPAWASDPPQARSAETVVSLARDEDASASAQRRRRARRGESADGENNPYGGEGGEEGAAPAEGAPAASSAVSGSDDPRTSGGGGNGGGGGDAAAGGGGGDAGGGLQRSDRLDFDERLIQGQTARAGAVYLFSRPPRDLPELVKLRRSFRAEISRTVLARNPITVEPETPPATPANGRNGARPTPAAGTSTTPATNGQTEGATEPANGGREGREGGREGREGRGNGRRGGHTR